MFIKLTFYPSNKPTILNVSSIKSIYQVYNKQGGEYNTKIEFNNGSYVNVYETLDEILMVLPSEKREWGLSE
jgi:hypothetical protein